MSLRAHSAWVGVAVFAATAASGCGGGGSSSGGGGPSRAVAPAAAAVSSDGRYAALELSRNDLMGYRDVVVIDVQSGDTTLASGNPAGASSNGDSYIASISSDGRYVAFVSSSTDLVDGLVGGGWNVFRRDVVSGVTDLVSATPEGGYGDGGSGAPRISPDGRYVAFESVADDLVADDTNGVDDVFVRDMSTGVTTRVSVDSLGTQANATSGWSDFTLETLGLPDLSADGRFVVFSSWASNLVDGDDNAAADVFLHDMKTGETRRVSVDSTGAEGFDVSMAPVITSDGRYVAFVSRCDFDATGGGGFFEAYRHDTETGETHLVSAFTGGGCAHGDSQMVTLSDDGRFAAFDSDAEDLGPGHPYGTDDVFLHDCDTGATTRVEPVPDQVEYFPTISADGRYLFYGSFDRDTSSRYAMYVYDRSTGTSEFLADTM